MKLILLNKGNYAKLKQFKSLKFDIFKYKNVNTVYSSNNDLGVDKILNKINGAISEVSQWFENQGFVPYLIFVVDVIYANFHSKLSDEVCENFKKEFGGEIFLNEASYTNDGKISKFKYHCDSSLLEECRNKLRVFLRANDYPYSFFYNGW